MFLYILLLLELLTCEAITEWDTFISSLRYLLAFALVLGPVLGLALFAAILHGNTSHAMLERVAQHPRVAARAESGLGKEFCPLAELVQAIAGDALPHVLQE